MQKALTVYLLGIYLRKCVPHFELGPAQNGPPSHESDYQDSPSTWRRLESPWDSNMIWELSDQEHGLNILISNFVLVFNCLNPNLNLQCLHAPYSCYAHTNSFYWDINQISNLQYLLEKSFFYYPFIYFHVWYYLLFSSFPFKNWEQKCKFRKSDGYNLFPT